MRIALAAIFALLTVNAWAQALLTAIGRSSDPPTLLMLQVLIGATAAATTIGIWRGRSWAAGAALGYGVITGGMIVSLEHILGLGSDARGGLWMGGAMVMLFAALVAWYLRRGRIREGEVDARVPQV